MIKVVAFDLDTLTNKNGVTFKEQYQLALSEYISTQINTDVQFEHLISGLVSSILPDIVLVADRFEASISRALKIPAEKTAALLKTFYENLFPQLREFVQLINSDDAKFIELLRIRDYGIVIVTDPIYPEAIINYRLQWAGIPVNSENCALVTHSSNMHFLKNDPAFYVEIAARVGVEPDEVLFVGEASSTSSASAIVGLRGSAVTPTDTNCFLLSDLSRKVLESNWLDEFHVTTLSPAMIEPELRGNMGALVGILATGKPIHWHQHPDPNEWSPIQIICHLLESESATQLKRLKRILEEDNPFLVNPTPPEGAKAIPCDDDAHRVLARFIKARQDTIHWLSSLTQNDWNRPARHSIFGPTSLLEMAHFTAQHDRLHINQLCQTLGRCI